MRDIVLLIASLAGAAILTALAVLIRPESPLWKFVLWGGIGVFIACACVFLIDYNKPNEPKALLGGIGLGIALVIGCTIALVFRPGATTPDVMLSIRLPRLLAYESTDLVTAANGQDAVINGFRLVVHNNGPETLLWGIKHLSLSIDGAKLHEMGETAIWPVPGMRFSDLPIKFITPLQVAHGAKQVTAEIEISYDNDPPLGIRTVWQKVEYPIAWFDTQAPLFNTIHVVAHREGP
ncbi:MAG: hypothetical protein ACREC9_07685 [Methylocella sp.]